MFSPSSAEVLNTRFVGRERRRVGPPSAVAAATVLVAFLAGVDVHAAPPRGADAGTRERGKLDSSAVRLVTGDPAQSDGGVAVTPPTATIRIVPVPAKVGAYPPGTTISLNILYANAGGFRAWFEVQVFGWDPDRDHVPAARMYQATIDATGYLGDVVPGQQPDIAPAVVACAFPDNSACVAAFGESWAKCEVSGRCKAGYNSHDPLRVDAFCGPSPEYCNQADVDTTTADFRYFGIYNSAERPDLGAIYYGGTLVLDIPADAKGRYTVSLKQDATFLADTSLTDIPTAAETGFAVSIATGSCCFGLGTPNEGCADWMMRAECGDDEPWPFIFLPGNTCMNGCCECVDDIACDDHDRCTIEACNLAMCQCMRRPKTGFDPATQCCDPNTGAVQPRVDDGDGCTIDGCFLGVPQHWIAPSGTPCNDSNVCTMSDKCDGIHTAAQGGCVGTDLYTRACSNTRCPASNPNGVPCDDLNPCTINDVCDAQRNCRGTPDPGCPPDYQPAPINCACANPSTRSIALLAPPNTPEPLTALRVRMMDLQSPNPPNAPCCPPPGFSMYESPTCTATGEGVGCVRWVGKPGTFPELQDNPGLGNYRAARLQCTPYYRDWSLEGVVHVTGAEIVPSSIYYVESVSAACTGHESACTAVSAPVQIPTTRSGDIAARFNPPSSSGQPDAIDVAQVVNKFKNVPGAPIKSVAQLQPNLPELNADINALDISAVVDAVKGLAYPFSGPCPCPSAVVCGQTACPSGVGTCVMAYGPGATCVKTCSGGANDGQPCVDNNVIHNHCPGGTCGNPMCRDACGRCSP